MRTKKYRAWDKVTETYLYSDTFPAMWLFFKELANRGIRHWETEDYTGLQDKQTLTDIYEGDVVNLIPQGYAVVPAVIQWSDKELRWVCHRPETDTGSYLTSDSELEVIGNIMEHPELMR